jgi:hypothetical protein
MELALASPAWMMGRRRIARHDAHGFAIDSSDFNFLPTKSFIECLLVGRVKEQDIDSNIRASEKTLPN